MSRSCRSRPVCCAGAVIIPFLRAVCGWLRSISTRGGWTSAGVSSAPCWSLAPARAWCCGCGGWPGFVSGDASQRLHMPPSTLVSWRWCRPFGGRDSRPSGGSKLWRSRHVPFYIHSGLLGALSSLRGCLVPGLTTTRSPGAGLHWKTSRSGGIMGFPPTRSHIRRRPWPSSHGG